MQNSGLHFTYQLEPPKAIATGNHYKTDVNAKLLTFQQRCGREAQCDWQKKETGQRLHTAHSHTHRPCANTQRCVVTG